MNKDSLFDVPVQLSPRLAWLKGRSVKVYQSDIADCATPWVAHALNATPSETSVCVGETQDEAIVALAKANGWRLWNEQ